MPKKQCKKDKFHQEKKEKFACSKCRQTAASKEKLCKPEKG